MSLTLGEEFHITTFADITSEVAKAVSPIGAVVVPEFITPEDASIMSEQIEADWDSTTGRRPLTGNDWFIDHRDQLSGWRDILANIRGQFVQVNAPVSDLFHSNPGLLRIFGPGNVVGWHSDGPLHNRELNIALSFSNCVDFVWIDENGQDHSQAAPAGALTIVRDGIMHNTSVPQLPGSRVVGAHFS